jgi:hypothetical protein
MYFSSQNSLTTKKGVNLWTDEHGKKLSELVTWCDRMLSPGNTSLDRRYAFKLEDAIPDSHCPSCT